MGQLPSTDELLAAVSAAGWLLEHQAVRILDEAGMHPRAGWAFSDTDDPTTSRELDVWSYRQFLRDEDTKVFVSARFLVECKQSANPYACVGHDVPEWRFRENPEQHVLPTKRIQQPADDGHVLTPAWDALGFRDLARQHGETPFRATQLTRLDRAQGGSWSANNAGVFTSLVYPLAKALRASQKGLHSRDYAFSNQLRRDWWDFALHFPVVLISAPLYVVDASTDSPAVEERKWVTAIRQLDSKSVSGTFEFDVVTADAFAEYVGKRIAFAAALADLVSTDPRKFTGELEPVD